LLRGGERISDFEKSFSDFIDRREYDQAANALLSMVRISFTAGWLAAGGNAPPPQKVIELHIPARENLLDPGPDSIETDIKTPDDKD
jgi:hypothetical protein